MTRPTTLPPPVASQSRSDRLLELWGDRDIDEVRFVLLDTETTGTEETAKILEVAARGWSTHPTRVYPKPYEALVNPGTGVLIPQRRHCTDCGNKKETKKPGRSRVSWALLSN